VINYWPSLCAGLGIAALSLATPPASQLQHYEGLRMSMACAYAIEAYAGPGVDLRVVVEEAFDEVDRIDRLMSHYKADSPVSRLNREAARHAVSLDKELFDFIERSLRYSGESDGAFDITVGPLMKAWGFFRGEYRVPDARELAGVQGRVGARHVILDRDARTIAFDTEGVELDLGGIAKGYAVDRVVELLRARHVTAALVSAGGSSVYGLGSPPARDAWEVKIQDPVDASKVAQSVALKDASLSVAGGAEKSFAADGVTYTHIMDPRTGQPVQGMLSVAVVTPSATAGDALDDAFFVLGTAASEEYLHRLRNVDVWFFLPAANRSWRAVHKHAGI
jgi:FAD:protein FMN transferase